METNEIMENEEVMDAVENTAEKIMKEVPNNSRMKDFCIGGLVGAVSVLAVRYIIIPAVKKAKGKRKHPDVIDGEYKDVTPENDSNEEVETEE